MLEINMDRFSNKKSLLFLLNGKYIISLSDFNYCKDLTLCLSRAFICVLVLFLIKQSSIPIPLVDL